MTTTPTTQLLSYECTLGLSAMQGRGFYYPTDTVIGDNGRLYVVNRSVEIVEIGVRVTMCDMDGEFYGTFGFYGREDGQFVWHAAGAMNSQGHIYLIRRIPAPGKRIRCRRKFPGSLGNARQR